MGLPLSGLLAGDGAGWRGRQGVATCIDLPPLTPRELSLRPPTPPPAFKGFGGGEGGEVRFRLLCRDVHNSLYAQVTTVRKCWFVNDTVPSGGETSGPAKSVHSYSV